MKAFDCKMCGECCKGKGGIRLVKEEIKAIAECLKITKKEFLKKYCVLNRNYYYITHVSHFKN
jgi:Fe-S-cluster containining protein